MFALLVHPEHGLPVICSINDNNYPDYLMAGYKEIATGRKREIEEEAEELLQEIYQN
jgi:hypothetical protein